MPELVDSEQTEKRRKILSSYLGTFFSPDIGEPLHSIIVKYFKKKICSWKDKDCRLQEPVLRVRANNLKELRQITQLYILSFEERVSYASFTTGDLITNYFIDKSLVNELRDYPVLIIFHGMPQDRNRLTGEHTNSILGLREIDCKPTLFISCKDDEYFKGIEYVTFTSVSTDGKSVGGISTAVN